MSLKEAIIRIEEHAHYTEEHFHTRERWFGKSGDQSGNNWMADTLTPFQCISGNGDYGSDANDEAKVVGSDDTPVISGMVKFDFHRILVVGVSEDTKYKLQFIWGTGTMADAITAEQYTEVEIKFDSTNPQQSAGVPVNIKKTVIDDGTKVWARCKNITDNATLDFKVGLHEYDE